MWQNFKNWAKSPYQSDMDALHWFFFFGLLIVVATAWGLILRTIKEVT